MSSKLYYYKCVFFPEDSEDCMYYSRSDGIAGFEHPREDKVLLCKGGEDALRAYLKNESPKRAIRKSLH